MRTVLVASSDTSTIQPICHVDSPSVMTPRCRARSPDAALCHCVQHQKHKVSEGEKNTQSQKKLVCGIFFQISQHIYLYERNLRNFKI